MKLLVTGDWHYRSQNPVARLDELQPALDAKLVEVGEVARRERCEAVIVPGDLTDSPNLAYSTLTRLENAIRGMGVQVWSVPGNHDEHAHSLDSLERTAYGHLVATGLVRDLSLRPVETDVVTVTGAGFSASTDGDASDYLARPTANATKGSVRIHVAHGMLLERSPGFELKHTLLEDVARHPECPGLLIVGHEHLGFGVKRLPRASGGDLVAVNPGALVRLSAHPGEIERTVQICLLEVYPGVAPRCGAPGCEYELSRDGARSEPAAGRESHEWVVACPDCGGKTIVRLSEHGPPEVWGLGHPVVEATLIPLSSARPGHEVLSRQHIEAAADREAKMGEFLGLLAREGEAKFLALQAILEGVANTEGLPTEVVTEALRRIAAARESLGRGRAA